MNIFSRIQELADIKQVTMYAVSQDTGISQSVFSRLKNEPTTKLNRKNLEILANYFCVNANWLATGIGDRYEPGIVKDTLIHDDALCERLETLGVELFTPQNNKSMYGIDYHEFGRQTDISEERLYQIIRNEKFPTYTEVLKIVNSKDININAEWLLIGKGPMLKSEKPSLVAKVNYESKGSPYYNVDFIGGFDLIENNQTTNPDYYIDFQPYNKDGIVWCNVTGHSMEPEIHHGDMIAIKDTNEINPNYLPFGEVYALVTKNYRTIKRLSKSDKDNFIRLIPTNTSPEYAPQDIPIESIIKIYQVLASVKRFY